MFCLFYSSASSKQQLKEQLKLLLKCNPVVYNFTRTECIICFRCHMLVDGNNLRESFDRAEFSLIVELWFHELSPVHLAMVCSRTLQLNMSPIDGLHYNLPILFDYFHLSALSLTIHSTLTALHQPPLK